MSQMRNPIQGIHLTLSIKLETSDWSGFTSTG